MSFICNCLHDSIFHLPCWLPVGIVLSVLISRCAGVRAPDRRLSARQPAPDFRRDKA